MLRAIASGSGMFSSAVSVGSRLKDWKTKPMWRRRSLVSPDPPDETRILARGVQRRRYAHQLDTRSASKQVSCLIRTEILGELCVDGERMPGKDRHTDTSGGDAKIGNVQDLP